MQKTHCEKGVLAGVEAPPYIKMGKDSIMSKRTWRAHIRKVTNTAQPIVATDYR